MSQESTSRDFINKTIDNLIMSLGVKDNISFSEYEKILHDQGLKELIKTIATQIGLPVNIKLTFIPSHYTPGVQYYGTQALSTTDSRGRGIEYIAAQEQCRHGR